MLSLLLHVLILMPWPGFHRETPPSPERPPLAATLLAPVLATEKALSSASAEQTHRLPSPVTAPPAPTLAATSRPSPPRELQGRALATALAAVVRETFYPHEAIARGLEGRVVLLLTLEASGTVQTIEVASSSGHALLDAAALKAAARIETLPGGRHQVLLPVEFRLE